ncbi:hypothetical protein NQ318_022347 [Aromia moschata]|uniref:P-loop containing nucleoside triphosphate hydrolase protein n=1 Tax=Aromia moschata TaxID=1265417 RepID=A0AAV8Z5R6_9CUCU|nr:hypothetical protein NQ318_022347 [Aromia moschata]
MELAVRSIEEIPIPYRSIFNEYPCFNAVQSKVLDDILHTDHSVVISSPTGSGKTVIFELAIVRLLTQCENLNVSQDLKIVYISPIKSLCQERLVDWHRKFSPFGLNCASFTGDSDNVDFQQLTNHNLIISTPEKWDSLTRKWRDNQRIVKVVKLFLIDEVHLLNEENRGSTLEVIVSSVVSRMKTVEKTIVFSANDGDVYNQKIRFLALSATVPNVEDIAEWLGKPPQIKYHRFSEEMRPVKLKKIVLGYSYNPKTMSPFKFDLTLNYKLQSLIMQHSEGKPTLIFLQYKEKRGNDSQSHSADPKNPPQRRAKAKIDGRCRFAYRLQGQSDHKARHWVSSCSHIPWMIADTRHAIENLFRRGDLPVLVTTSSLAMGVNLPAHLVIVKSTKCYDTGGFRDYTETAIHQMIGRAGRPQFDVSATALILTTNEDKAWDEVTESDVGWYD